MNSESFREFESVFNENESKIILLPDIRSYLFFRILHLYMLFQQV